MPIISKIKNNDKERKQRKGEMRLMLTHEPRHLIFKIEDFNEYQLALETILLRIINNKNDFQSDEHCPQTSKSKDPV